MIKTDPATGDDYSGWYLAFLTREAYEDLYGVPSVWLKLQFWLYGYVNFRGFK